MQSYLFDCIKLVSHHFPDFENGTKRSFTQRCDFCEIFAVLAGVHQFQFLLFDPFKLLISLSFLNCEQFGLIHISLF